MANTTIDAFAGHYLSISIYWPVKWLKNDNPGELLFRDAMWIGWTCIIKKYVTIGMATVIGVIVMAVIETRRKEKNEPTIPQQQLTEKPAEKKKT